MMRKVKLSDPQLFSVVSPPREVVSLRFASMALIDTVHLTVCSTDMFMCWLFLSYLEVLSVLEATSAIDCLPACLKYELRLVVYTISLLCNQLCFNVEPLTVKLLEVV